MSDSFKDYRTTTANDLKIGDKVRFIEINRDENFKVTHLSYFFKTVSEFRPTKSGKRVRVVFENYGEWSLQGWDTTLETSPQSFWDEMFEKYPIK